MCVRREIKYAVFIMEEGFKGRLGGRSTGPINLLFAALIGIGMLLYGLFTRSQRIVLYAFAIFVVIGVAVVLMRVLKPVAVSSPAK